MKRFRRWLFNGVAVLSLLLCAATGFVWKQGYSATYYLIISPMPDNFNGECRWTLQTSRGVCVVAWVQRLSKGMPQKPNTLQYNWSFITSAVSNPFSPWLYLYYSEYTSDLLFTGQAVQINLHQIYFPLRNLCFHCDSGFALDFAFLTLAASIPYRLLSPLRIRPPRHPRPMPGMRNSSRQSINIQRSHPQKPPHLDQFPSLHYFTGPFPKRAHLRAN